MFKASIIGNSQGYLISLHIGLFQPTVFKVSTHDHLFVGFRHQNTTVGVHDLVHDPIISLKYTLH